MHLLDDVHLIESEILAPPIHCHSKASLIALLTFDVFSSQFLELQLIHLGDSFEEGFPRGLTKLCSIVILLDPVLEGVIPTANAVSMVVVFDGVDK